jgi:hypothetical protein
MLLVDYPFPFFFSYFVCGVSGRYFLYMLGSNLLMFLTGSYKAFESLIRDLVVYGATWML